MNEMDESAEVLIYNSKFSLFPKSILSSSLIL